jgi:hypothetical protein
MYPYVHIYITTVPTKDHTSQINETLTLNITVLDVYICLHIILENKMTEQTSMTRYCVRHPENNMLFYHFRQKSVLRQSHTL